MELQFINKIIDFARDSATMTERFLQGCVDKTQHCIGGGGGERRGRQRQRP